MRLAKVRTNLLHPQGKRDIPSLQGQGQGHDFSLNAVAVKTDRVTHGNDINGYVNKRQGSIGVKHDYWACQALNVVPNPFFRPYDYRPHAF